MRATHAALLLASVLAAAAEAAPAPFPKGQRHVPSPTEVLARLRAEGFEVGGLKHEGADRWTIELVVSGSLDASSSTLEVERRVIVAPGDPTDRLRRCGLLEKKW